uniref:DUF4604 domain-containing protein n=1 Tax=Schistocephalus solidus TaxID=70667 RepID=A0A183SCN7_SCHSO
LHPITGVPLSDNRTRIRYLIPTEALKRVSTEREAAKKGDLTTPNDGVEPEKFEKCIEDLTSSSTMQVVDEESEMEEDDQQVDEKKLKLKKVIKKPEDAEPLVFDVSQ